LFHDEARGRGSDLFALEFQGELARNMLKFLGYSDYYSRKARSHPNFSIEEATTHVMRFTEPLFAKRAYTADYGVFIYTVAMILGMRYKDQALTHFEVLIPSIAKTILNGVNAASDESWTELKAEWRADETIMTDLVYTKGFPEIAMASRVLRYMATKC
jgi:hypothetical protein